MFKIINYNRLKGNTDDKINNNIFKSIKDNHCYFLNKKNKHMMSNGEITDNHYFKDQSGNICKFVKDLNILDWEEKVYLTFFHHNIFPIISSTQHHIIYHTNYLISLRSFLNDHNQNININYVLNELFSFINSFKLYGFIHGNLNIDNIFVYSNNYCLDFYVIDLSNSYIHIDKHRRVPLYKRTTFLGDDLCIDMDIEYNLDKYSDWDFITVYVSLKLFLEKINKLNSICILDNVISNYVDINHVNNLLKLALTV